jgi:alpha-galactosidase
VELDQSNGGAGQGDGNLLAVGGTVYDRGLGTSTGSDIRYYLGGRCSGLTADVGIDEEDATGAGAGFTVYADDTAAAAATAVPGAAPQALTADLTGAAWLRLVTTAGATVHTDWATPILTCGDAGPSDPVQPAERTLSSFESGTDGWTIANAGGGGSAEQSPAFHTDGQQGLLVHTPTNGNWFGHAVSLDLTGASTIKFDLKAAGTGSVGEIALQVGDGYTWCQGGLWTWTDPGASRTVARSLSQIGCPAGVTLDPAQIRAVWVFLNGGGDVWIDNLRVE